jgi:glycosyltransferase involved in cell wall biosynthesis
MIKFYSSISSLIHKKTYSIDRLQSRVLLIDSDGFTRYTSYLALGLAKYREITLYGFSKEDHVATGAAKEKRIEFHWIKEHLPKESSSLRGIARVFLLFFILSVILTKTNYEIVHIQEHLPAFFLFIPILKLKRKQICWTLHDTDIFAPSKGIGGKLRLLFLKAVSQPGMMIKHADVILVHAMSLRKQLEEKGVNKQRVHVIPHFDYRYLVDSYISTDNFDTDDKDSKKIIKIKDTILPKEYVLFFGDIAPWKGVDIFINAAKLVRKRRPETRFNVLIAGTSFYQDNDISNYEHLLSKEDYEYIHIINKYITSSEIPDIFTRSRVVVLPYTNAFQYSVSGIIPLAYTFSRPVIVSNVGSLVEYVDHGKTGFVFEAGKSEQLADYIIELLNDESKCIEMGKSGYEKMMEEMSLEKCCETINALYKNKRG